MNDVKRTILESISVTLYNAEYDKGLAEQDKLEKLVFERVRKNGNETDEVKVTMRSEDIGDPDNIITTSIPISLESLSLAMRTLLEFNIKSKTGNE